MLILYLSGIHIYVCKNRWIKKKGMHLNHDFYDVVMVNNVVQIMHRRTISFYKLTNVLLLFIYFNV